ncbi:MAG: GNAT family N-acetyltransferase [Chitinophagaceae bacterium]|nr:GNAT family N-acetyltransferase [Chitinophagaceae bacterium]
MGTNSNVHTRLATINDQDFITSLLPRLTEFGPPSWRDVAGMISTDTQILVAKLSNIHPGTIILVAEDDQKIPLGFIHLQGGNDYYYKEKHAHISDVIVVDKAAGRGIGLILIREGEAWARAQGFRWLTLSVFAQNVRARELYSRLGYGEDIMKYVKEL